MKKFASLLAVASIVLVFGFYRGWFILSGGQEASGHKVDVTLTVDPDQVKRDADTVKTKVRLTD
jgi:hypothetical protein